MPTFSLRYGDLPDHRNLWKEPAAAILDPKGVFRPADPTRGERNYPSETFRKNDQDSTARLLALQRASQREHPIYLAASGGPVFDSLSGISMHTEIELLVRLGLTLREALAARPATIRPSSAGANSA
jgi:hypothetical protein